MKVKAHILKKMEFREFYSTYRFQDHLRDPDVYNNYLNITCLMHNPDDNLLYCGLTAFNNDLMYTFDTDTGRFQSCNYSQVAEKYEVKLHHSLELGADGMIYGAAGCLHDVDEYMEAPGGSIFKFDPKLGSFEKIGIPIPHEYIQMVVLDRTREIIYGTTYPVPKAFRCDIRTGKMTDLGFINCFPEKLALDDEGCFWGNWRDSFLKKTKLFRYDPDADKMEWLDLEIPSTPVVSPYYGKSYDNEIDTVLCVDGYLYIATEVGMFLRFDIRNREFKCLGKPLVELRLTGLAMGPDGLIYGVGGDRNNVDVFTYDLENEKFSVLGRLYDSEMDELAYRPHDICFGGNGKLYVAETDTPRRSSFLWECDLA